MIRIYLLRILISWWLIPFTWLFTPFLIWLIIGDWDEAIYFVRDFTHFIWNGAE